MFSLLHWYPLFCSANQPVCKLVFAGDAPLIEGSQTSSQLPTISKGDRRVPWIDPSTQTRFDALMKFQAFTASHPDFIVYQGVQPGQSPGLQQLIGGKLIPILNYISPTHEGPVTGIMRFKDGGFAYFSGTAVSFRLSPPPDLTAYMTFRGQIDGKEKVTEVEGESGDPTEISLADVVALAFRPKQMQIPPEVQEIISRELKSRSQPILKFDDGDAPAHPELHESGDHEAPKNKPRDIHWIEQPETKFPVYVQKLNSQLSPRGWAFKEILFSDLATGNVSLKDLLGRVVLWLESYGPSAAPDALSYWPDPLYFQVSGQIRRMKAIVMANELSAMEFEFDQGDKVTFQPSVTDRLYILQPIDINNGF